MKIDIMHMRNPPHSPVQTKYLYKRFYWELYYIYFKTKWHASLMKTEDYIGLALPPPTPNKRTRVLGKGAKLTVN